MMDDLFPAAVRLHNYILRRHWSGDALEGPDAGIRFNSRIGRFVKSYLGFLPWNDNLRYLQAQGYWTLANWLMYRLSGGDLYRELALATSNWVLSAQHPEGYWDYPNPEWGGRIATVEGDFAAIGLIESYARSGLDEFLDGAKRWHRYVLEGVGFQGEDGILAVNYFANFRSNKVPNNSTLTLWTFARLAEATGDQRYLERSEEMVAWLKRVQLESGELPYAVAGRGGKDRTHFLCYQYNAFEFLDLAEYHRLTGDSSVWEILRKLSRYLAGGLTASGAGRYDCQRATPELPYYTAALGAALSRATALGLGDFHVEAERAYGRVLSQIGPDGRLAFHSTGNYGLLTDRRSYPRYLSMILYHLLTEVVSRGSAPAATTSVLRR